ncbi:odorant receptor Or1 isoform X2 [Tribolium castaneum]|uniref:odorant receptor Or1 isoform X2 n=1 Tax=Tribolium castaneum TaxID=7070 RepID=UPI0030FE8576
MYLDLNKGIADNTVLFRIMGHWPFGNPKLYRVYTHFVLINMYLYNLTSLINMLKNLDDTEEVTATIYNLLSTVAVIIKANIFHYHFNHVKTIVTMFESEAFQPKNKQQEKILKNGIFWARFIFYYFFLTADLTLVMWILFPIMDGERRFPSNAWFPYDYLSGRNYTLTYIWQSIFIIYHALSNVCMDTFFAMLMVQTGAQCDVLNNQVSLLGKESVDSDTVRGELGKCIHHHKLILKLAETIGLVFRNIVLVQFATSVSVLCETMFLLSLVKTLNATFVMLLFYQVAIFTQIFLYCWFGNEVVLKSAKLYYSAYESRWYECPQSFKKDLLFFMQRTQKPIVLFVGKMFPITILRSSWAYFMALRKVHDKS